jgi:hypothetical protein
MNYEYKVAELYRNNFFTGRVDAKDVERLINEIAALGWEFVSLTSQGGVVTNSAVLAVFRRPTN